MKQAVVGQELRHSVQTADAADLADRRTGLVPSQEIDQDRRQQHWEQYHSSSKQVTVQLQEIG